jgi:hypothetical protein
MRGTIVLGGVAVLAVVTGIGAGAVVLIQRDHAADAAAYTTVSCNASLGPTTTGATGSGAADAANLKPDQLATVTTIIAIGKQRELPPRAWQIAIQAGMTESGLRPLNYGDRDSLGIFQMRPSMGWGTPAEVTDPEYAVNKFYDVLLEVPNWDTQRPGDSAQDVERSAFPDRYHEWEAMATHLIGDLGQVVNASGCGPDMGRALPPATKVAGAAIQFALGQQGKPYQWGALTTHQNSFDCSSLMLQAYRDAGVSLPRTSREQWRAGAHLPVEKSQPGDLLFWARDTSDPATIHHVAMYLGDGKMVEAQQNGVPVHIRNIEWTEGGLMDYAVRPGV